MSVFTEKNSNKIDIIFILALITLFAATAFMLVLIGAKQYRHVTTVMSENHYDRTTSAYLAEKIRQNDTAGAITVTELEGIPALSIRSTEEGITYTTYIYCHDDALRELVVTEHSVFSLSAGHEIIALKDFHPQFLYDSLLCVEITSADDDTQLLYFPLHSGVRKEVP